jgi:hypothetical protein
MDARLRFVARLLEGEIEANPHLGGCATGTNAAQRSYRSTPPTVVRPVPLQPSSP